MIGAIEGKFQTIGSGRGQAYKVESHFSLATSDEFLNIPIKIRHSVFFLLSVIDTISLVNHLVELIDEAIVFVFVFRDIPEIFFGKIFHKVDIFPRLEVADPIGP